jgi:molybdate-binding protein
MLAAEPTLHDTVLIGFAAREQGLVVAVGSPLQLKSPGEAQARHLARHCVPQGPGVQQLLLALLRTDGLGFEGLRAVLVAPTGPDIAEAIRAGNADFASPRGRSPPPPGSISSRSASSVSTC